jgi:hypothetical protein
MTYNIPATIFNVLVAAFFIVVILGVVLGAYAATALKRCEGESAEPPAKPTPPETEQPAA